MFWQQRYWKIMELCDWRFEGDDDKVLAPVVQFLSQKDDSFIFKFEDTIFELLHNLDTETVREGYKKNSEYISDDDFLYWRCTVLINGKQYYEKVRKGSFDCSYDLEFESLLYIAEKAWAQKHNTGRENYLHIPKYFE